MIDRATGRILLEGETPLTVDPGLTRTDFLKATSGRQVKLLVENGPWETYSISCCILNQDWVSGFCFKGETLHMVDMALATGAKNWSDWSEEKERRKLAEHDELLKAMLGSPPYSFAWGRVESSFDRKSGGSCVSMRYRY